VAGGRIDILVAPDLRGFIPALRSGLSPAVGVAAGVGASLGVAFGGAAVAFGRVIEIGNEFTSSLNTMKAVAGATADQMAQVSEKAKQLGNDAQLPGTSANDAAAAMVELTKGGFSVYEAMEAARGSLALAAAAEVEAAEAARIQSSALQAFSLDASQASRVADVLANTANASSAEISGVAYALQSGGAVAKQFGLSIEDTAAAIGLMANSGIQGSDAGTLLKSALLALTDTGKPAQAAMEELGLTVYDAEGKFVGLHRLFEQLEIAAGRMTPEMYQAATSTLFGSDAMRLAAIAAEKGVEGYDKMHDAMSKTGSAIDVAAAKMQGLPGAMQRIENAAQTLALDVYDLVKGPMEDLAGSAAEGIEAATPRIVDGLQAAGEAAVDVAKAIGPLVSAIAGLPGPVLAAAAAFVVLRTTSIASMFATAASAAGSFLVAARNVVTATGGVANVAGMGAVAMGRFGSAVQQLGTHAPVVANMQRAYMNAATAASTFGRTAGTVAAATTGIRSAASGVISMLGGPWVVGIVAAAAALYQLHNELKASDEHAKAMRASLRDLAATRSELAELFSLNKGAINAEAIQNVTAQIGIMKKSLDEAADYRPGFFEKNFTPPWMDDARNKEWYADQWEGAKKVIDDLKMSDEQLAETLADTSKFNDLAAKLREMGTHGSFALSELTALRDGILQTQAVARNTTPGFATLSQAVKVLADDSASAADRIDAMKTALDLLAGKPIAAQDALAKYNQQVLDTAAATTEAWDAAAGFGDALLGEGGTVNTQTANGQRLYDTLTKIRDATITAAEAGIELGPIIAQNDQQFQQLATSTGLTQEQVTQMAAALGYLPKDIEILAGLRGAESVEQQLRVIEGLLKTNADGIEIPVDALTDDARARLEEVGARVEDVNGKPGIVKVSAPDVQAVVTALDQLIAKRLPAKTQEVKVTYTGDFARLDNGNSRQPLPVTPRADGGIDNLPSQATVWSPRTRLYQVSEPETMGEAFIPLAPSKRARSTAILGQVAEMFGMAVTPMAEGGIATDRAMSFLRSQSGKPYQYGGVGNPSWDCSAFISAAYALLKGLDPYVRWFTTESDFSSLGFLSGRDPSGRGLNIGVYRGGGGQYSHMAGDLNGIALESGANGVLVGGGAQSSASSELPLKFYLPASAFNPPDGSSSNSRSRNSRSSAKTWTESDELELESARISAAQAAATRDKDLADPEKTPEEKRQSEINARQAQIRVEDKEKEKTAATTSGGPVPAAPELTGSMTDDEIQLANLQQAVQDAMDDRDYVYADPDSTDADKADADRKAYAAMNALADEQKRQREELTGSSSSFSNGSAVGLLGDAISEAVTGQVSDVLSVIGLGGDIGGVTGAAINIGAYLAGQAQKNQPTPASPGQAEVAKQGPVVPGSANWIEELMKTLRIPAVVRDQGGPLPNNTVAINTSGETEWVFTGAQMRQAAASRARAQQTFDQRLVIENLHTGMSAGEFHREMKMVELDRRDRVRGLVPR